MRFINISVNYALHDLFVVGLKVKTFVVTCLVGSAVLLAAQPVSRRQILVLHSYNQGYHWTDEIQRGLQASFASETGMELLVEYLDANNHAGPEYGHLLSELYAFKYGSRAKPFEVIIATDDHALDFVLDHREGLFRDSPIVFCGINDFQPDRLRGQRGITGVNEAQSMRDTLELGFSLWPQTKRVAVLAGERFSERVNSETFKRAVADFDGMLAFEYIEGLTISEVRTALQSYGRDTVVVYLSYMQDAAGTILDWRDGISLALSNPDLPVLAMSDFQVRQGILGGKVASGYTQGEAAARLALRILGGEQPDSLPVLMDSPNVYRFDDRVLERFGIDYRDLPEPYQLVNLRSREFIANWQQDGIHSFFANDLLEFHGAAMLLIDPSSGVIVDANQAAKRFYGYPRLIGMKVADITLTEPDEFQDGITSLSLNAQSVFYGQDWLADGSIRDVKKYSWPVRVMDSDMLFSIVLDITPQRQAEALAASRTRQIQRMHGSLLLIVMLGSFLLIWLLRGKTKAYRQIRQRLRLQDALFDAIPNPVFYKDLDGRFQEWNKAFEQFIGRTADQIQGLMTKDFFEKDSALYHMGKDQELFSGKTHLQAYEAQISLPDQEPRDILVHKAIVSGEAGKPVGLVGIYTDLKERKQRENELRISLEKNQALIKELYHRTKNNMQVITSMVTLKMSGQEDPVLKEILTDIGQRIRTMALVHQLLYESGDLSRINMREYAEKLLSSTIESYMQGKSKVSYSLECPNLYLLIDHVLPCAMAVNELLTNSCKHAFVDRPQGKIEMKIYRTPENEVHVDYCDDGIGLDASAKKTACGTPLGFSMLHVLIEHQLGGSYDIDSSHGMHCHIKFSDNTYYERVSHENHAC